MVGPEGYFRGVFSPVASILTLVPPTSMTSTLGDFTGFSAFIAGLRRVEYHTFGAERFVCRVRNHSPTQLSRQTCDSLAADRRPLGTLGQGSGRLRLVE